MAAAYRKKKVTKSKRKIGKALKSSKSVKYAKVAKAANIKSSSSLFNSRKPNQAYMNYLRYFQFSHPHYPFCQILREGLSKWKELPTTERTLYGNKNFVKELLPNEGKTHVLLPVKSAFINVNQQAFKERMRYDRNKSTLSLAQRRTQQHFLLSNTDTTSQRGIRGRPRSVSANWIAQPAIQPSSVRFNASSPLPINIPKSSNSRPQSPRPQSPRPRTSRPRTSRARSPRPRSLPTRSARSRSPIKNRLKGDKLKTRYINENYYNGNADDGEKLPLSPDKIGKSDTQPSSAKVSDDENLKNKIIRFLKFG